MIKWFVLVLDFVIGFYLINIYTKTVVLSASLAKFDSYLLLVAGILLIVSGIGFFFWRNANKEPKLRR